jgi:thiol-disulfide isomerase/thioredoxin
MLSRFRSRSGPLSAGLPALLSASRLAAAILFAAVLAGSLAAMPAAAATPSGGKPKVGDPAPGFRLEGLGKARAGAVSLEALAGQVVLVDFWASWCAPCKRTLPELARLGARYPGLKVLAVSLDEDRSKALRFLAGQDSALLALHDARREVAERYDLAGMPAAVLIDRKGVLRARFDGYTERDLAGLEAEVRKLWEEKP